MAGIINGITSFVNIIKSLFSMIMNFFKTFILVFEYLANIVGLAFTVIFTFPPWVKSFATITIGICVVYFLIGRNSGKSD